jgi:hypothetical protein
LLGARPQHLWTQRGRDVIGNTADHERAGGATGNDEFAGG